MANQIREEDQRLLNEIDVAARERAEKYGLDVVIVKLLLLKGAELAIASDRRDVEAEFGV